MENSKITAINYFYEQDHCSGIFEYTVDDCEPLCIKFRARVRVKVVLDNAANQVFSCNGGDKSSYFAVNENDSANLFGNLQPKEIFEKGQDKNVESQGKESLMSVDIVNRESIPYQSTSDYDALIEQDEGNESEDHSERGQQSRAKYMTRLRNSLQANRQNYCLSGDSSERLEGASHSSEFEESLQESNSQKNDCEMMVQKNKGKNLRTKSKSKETIPELKRKCSQRSRSDEDEQQETKTKTDKALTCVPDIHSKIVSDDDSLENKSKGRSKLGKLQLEKNVKCIHCNVTFENKLDFFNHRRTKGANYECDICGKNHPFEAFLMVHKLSHESPGGYAEIQKGNSVKKKRSKMKCNICGLVVSSLDSLKVHMISHTDERPYQCCVCQDTFFSLSSLRHHLHAHQVDKRFHCKDCDLRFSSRGELSKHKLTHELKCGLCDECFPNKTSRTWHYRFCHQNDIKKCNECSSVFSTEEELEKHLLYHRSKKEQQCQECGVVVTRLKDHMKLHLKDSEKLYACDQCPQKYKRKAALDKHLLVHTGERPYACNLCPKTFRSQGMLRKHLFTHSSERPFVCEICGKQCSVRSNLSTHMRIHAKDKKYQCSKCFLAFNHKTSLEKHMRSKHNSQESVVNRNGDIQPSPNGQILSPPNPTIFVHSNPEIKKSMVENLEDQFNQMIPNQEPNFPQSLSMLPLLYSEVSHTAQASAGTHIPLQNSSSSAVFKRIKPSALETALSLGDHPHHQNHPISRMIDCQERTEIMSYSQDKAVAFNHHDLPLTYSPSSIFNFEKPEQLSSDANSITMAIPDQKSIPAPNKTY